MATPVQPAPQPSTIVGSVRPDITPVQIVSGIPILAELLHAFGVFTLSQAQQDSLGKMVTWAIALVGADAVIRVGRSVAKRL